MDPSRLINAATTSTANNSNGGCVGSIRAYGSTTQVPDSDYSRLSYYLKCCIIGCGIDFVFDVSLLDYQNSHLFDQDCKERIFRLAHDVFRADVLLGKVIFLDDENILMPHGISNVFYHVEAVSEFIQRPNTCTTLVGRQLQVHKVMVCSSQWINVFYFEPIARLIEHRLQQPPHQLQLIPEGPVSSSNVNKIGGTPQTIAENDAVHPDVISSHAVTPQQIGNASSSSSSSTTGNRESLRQDVVLAATSSATTSNYQVGQTVLLHGVSSIPQVNGQQAIIFNVVDNRFLVHVPHVNVMLVVEASNMVIL